MKPFNLQEALLGKPVVTRSGIPVTQITKFEVDEDSLLSVAGVLHGNLCVWTKEGLYDIIEGNTNSRDLVMAPEKKSIWVNLYFNEYGEITVSREHGSLEKASEATQTINWTFIKTIEITNEIEL
jgi:hypothetical protein